MKIQANKLYIVFRKWETYCNRSHILAHPVFTIWNNKHEGWISCETGLAFPAFPDDYIQEVNFKCFKKYENK